METAVHLIRGWIAAEWHKSRDETDKGRGVWQHLKRPTRADPWWKLHRRESAPSSELGIVRWGPILAALGPKWIRGSKLRGGRRDGRARAVRVPRLAGVKSDGNGQSFVFTL